MRIKKKKNVNYSIEKSFLAGIAELPVEYLASTIIILHLDEMEICAINAGGEMPGSLVI